MLANKLITGEELLDGGSFPLQIQLDWGAVNADGIPSARKHMFLLGHMLESTVSKKR